MRKWREREYSKPETIFYQALGQALKVQDPEQVKRALDARPSELKKIFYPYPFIDPLKELNQDSKDTLVILQLLLESGLYIYSLGPEDSLLIQFSERLDIIELLLKYLPVADGCHNSIDSSSLLVFFLLKGIINNNLKLVDLGLTAIFRSTASMERILGLCDAIKNQNIDMAEKLLLHGAKEEESFGFHYTPTPENKKMSTLLTKYGIVSASPSDLAAPPAFSQFACQFLQIEKILPPALNHIVMEYFIYKELMLAFNGYFLKHLSGLFKKTRNCPELYNLNNVLASRSSNQPSAVPPELVNLLIPAEDEFYTSSFLSPSDYKSTCWRWPWTSPTTYKWYNTTPAAIHDMLKYHTKKLLIRDPAFKFNAEEYRCLSTMLGTETILKIMAEVEKETETKAETSKFSKSRPACSQVTEAGLFSNSYINDDENDLHRGEIEQVELIEELIESNQSPSLIPSPSGKGLG